MRRSVDDTDLSRLSLPALKARRDSQTRAYKEARASLAQHRERVSELAQQYSDTASADPNNPALADLAGEIESEKAATREANDLVRDLKGSVRLIQERLRQSRPKDAFAALSLPGVVASPRPTHTPGTAGHRTATLAASGEEDELRSHLLKAEAEIVRLRVELARLEREAEIQEELTALAIKKAAREARHKSEDAAALEREQWAEALDAATRDALAMSGRAAELEAKVLQLESENATLKLVGPSTEAPSPSTSTPQSAAWRRKRRLAAIAEEARLG
jgi:hypothetical protein